MNKEESNVLVYNIGGGSLDVCIINIMDQLYEVKAMNGDTLLGGEEFVRRLYDYCLSEFNTRYKTDFSKNQAAIQ